VGVFNRKNRENTLRWRVVAVTEALKFSRTAQQRVSGGGVLVEMGIIN
jgi:hypothetical protein